MSRIANWENINYGNKRHMKTLEGLLKGYFTQHCPLDMKIPGAIYPVKMQNFREKALQLQNLTNPGSFQDVYVLAKQVLQEPMPDNGWMRFLERQDMDYNGYQVQTQADNVELKIIQPGGSVQIGSMAGQQYWVFAKWMGAGIGLNERDLKERKFITVEKHLRSLNNRTWRGIAERAYGLLGAMSSGINVAWQATNVDSTNQVYTALRDKNTIIKAIQELRTEHKDTGILQSLLNETFVIVVSDLKLQRVQDALSVRMQGFDQSSASFNYRVEIIPTALLPNEDVAYVGIPNGYNQYGMLVDLEQFDDFDIYKLVRNFVNWIAMGMNIFERQWRRIAFA